MSNPSNNELDQDMNTDVSPFSRTCPKVQPWLYGYDAEKEVEAVLESLRQSDGFTVEDRPEAAAQPSLVANSSVTLQC